MGATVAGYTSDMTRTMGSAASPKAKRIYKAVLESQLAALDAVKAGARSSAVDGAARNVLKEMGLINFLFIPPVMAWDWKYTKCRVSGGRTRQLLK